MTLHLHGGTAMGRACVSLIGRMHVAAYTMQGMLRCTSSQHGTAADHQLSEIC
jgi:hypothetical protein